MLAMPCLETVPTLTSGPAYPTILFSGLFGPGGAYVSYAIPGNQFLHSPVTLLTCQYRFLSHSDLGRLLARRVRE